VRNIVRDVLEPGLKLVVEFLLPRELLCSNPDLWEVETDDTYLPRAELRVWCPVLLRWRDRIVRAQKFGDTWSRNVAETMKKWNNAGEASIRWVRPDDLCSGSELLSTARAAVHDIVGLRSTPPEKPVGPDALFTFLSFGAPFIIWPRAEPADWDKLDEHVKALFNCPPFDDPAERIRAWQDQPSPPSYKDHPGRLLVVMWDTGKRTSIMDAKLVMPS
jgi:hypothetical protein